MTVTMTKDGKLADVHKDEVENYAAYGWAKHEADSVKNTLYDVYKVTDGEQSSRASKTNLTMSKAEAWIKGRDDTYNIVEAD